MLRKAGWSSKWLRLPSLLIVLLAILFLVTSPRAANDISADQVLGQEVFTLNSPNFIDGAGFNFSNGAIGDLDEAYGVAVDTKSTPKASLYRGLPEQPHFRLGQRRFICEWTDGRFGDQPGRHVS